MSTPSLFLSALPEVAIRSMLYIALVFARLTVQFHCTKTYIPTTWESIGYADGNVLNPAN